MGLAPKTQFVERDGAELAFQVFGHGTRNLLYATVPSHADYQWQFPGAIRSSELLGVLARVAIYDWRGCGMSDPLPPGAYSIDELAADALAVADAAGFERFVVFGQIMGGALAVWLAVHCPERVEAIVCSNASACLRAQPGYDSGLDDAEYAARRRVIESSWGTGATAAFLGASFASDERVVEEWGRYERNAGTTRAVLAEYELSGSLDVRDLLGKVAVPTLVIHSATNGLIPVAQGRYLAEQIAGARYVEVSADWADGWSGGIAGDIAEFLTGNRATAHRDRSLQVVLFADIVDSTAQMATMGDRAWRDLLAEFRRRVRAVLGGHGAREVNTRGDDFFAVVSSPSVAVQVARTIRSETASLGFAVRCGMHLGEVERHEDDFTGLAVHIGARIGALAGPGEILLSQTMRDVLVGSTAVLASRGAHHLKGVPGEWHVFALTD